jgi:hypothetical protein
MLPIQVTSDTSSERPTASTFDEDLYDTAVVLRNWHEASLTFFEVQTTDGKTLVFRHDEVNDEWTLNSRHLFSCKDFRLNGWLDLSKP